MWHLAPTKLNGPIIAKLGKLGHSHRWGSGQDSLVSAWQVPQGIVTCFCLESGVKSTICSSRLRGALSKAHAYPLTTSRVKISRLCLSRCTLWLLLSSMFRRVLSATFLPSYSTKYTSRTLPLPTKVMFPASMLCAIVQKGYRARR